MYLNVLIKDYGEDNVLIIFLLRTKMNLAVFNGLMSIERYVFKTNK